MAASSCGVARLDSSEDGAIASTAAFDGPGAAALSAAGDSAAAAPCGVARLGSEDGEIASASAFDGPGAAALPAAGDSGSRAAAIAANPSCSGCVLPASVREAGRSGALPS